MELGSKVDPKNDYPEEYKIRIFKKGLKPEIRKWVNLNADDTMESIIETAKNVEEADSDPLEQTYHQTQAQPTGEWSALAKVLQDLTSRLDHVESGRRYNNQSNNNNQQRNQPRDRTAIVCYSCGGKGHVSRVCPNNSQSVNQPSNNQNTT